MRYFSDPARMARQAIFLGIIAGLGCSVYGAEPSAALRLAGSDAAVVAPFRGLLYTPEDIKATRTVLQSEGASSKLLAARYIEAAQKWIDRGREGIDAMLPPDGSVYAFGLAGDPKNGKSWPRYGRSDDVCSLTRPGQVKSPYTGDIYGVQKPGEMYYDDGAGWVDPKTGTRYYFKGMWNCFAVWNMHEAVDDLAIAYMLTGDERCAELGLYMLDQFAGMRRRNPKNYGLIDYPHPVTAPGMGFFGYMGNIANDRMIYSALSFDLLAGSEFARSPSTGTDGLTVAQNIQQNYFEVFELLKIQQLNSFQNHAVAAYGAMLSQALLFGDAERTRLGIDLGYAFFDSCINRDGDYYEVSGNYAQLGRRYGGFLLNLLSNYRVDRYDPAAKMPNPSDYPYSLQFGNNPQWYAAAVEMLYRHTVMGRHLQYGDGHSDRFSQPGQVDPNLTRDRATYLSLLYYQTTRPEWRRSLAQRYWGSPDIHDTALKSDDVIRFGPAMWLEPKRPDVVTADTGDEASDIMPAKGLAVLRSGKGEYQRDFYMRGGAANSHAHDDQMALTLYGAGMSLTGEYGYFYYGTPDFCGWGTRSIAHNMVVVNEDLPQPPFNNIAPWKRVPPADIKAVALRKPAQMVEMTNPGMWKGVAQNMQDYRRTAWLIDLSDKDYYFVDVFQVVGGNTHDYAWHSPYLEPRLPNDGFSVSGVDLAPKDGVWVLAAQDNEKIRNATYNKPGQAWGERLLGESGRIKDLKIPGEKVGYSQWNPPPGNGYGFIYNLRSAPTSNDWSAQWLLPDRKNSQRLYVLNYDGMTAISGQEPVLDDKFRQAVVIARRTQPADVSDPLQSRFVTVNEVGTTNSFPLLGVHRLETSGSAPEQDRVALTVESKTGVCDTILVNRQGGQAKTADGVILSGSRGFVRRDTASGTVTDMLLQDGTLLASGEVTLEASASAWEAAVTGVTLDENGFSLELNQSLPAGERLRGAMASFSCPGDALPQYSHESWFRIEQIEASNGTSRLTFNEQQVVMAYLEVETVNKANNTVTTRFPCELLSLPEMNYFTGRYAMLVSDKTQLSGSRVTAFKDKKTFVVENAADFKQGDRVAILAVQKGDLLRIPSQVTLNRIAADEYELHSTHDVIVTLPGRAALSVKMESLPTGGTTLKK